MGNDGGKGKCGRLKGTLDILVNFVFVPICSIRFDGTKISLISPIGLGQIPTLFLSQSRLTPYKKNIPFCLVPLTKRCLSEHGHVHRNCMSAKHTQ